MPWNVTFVTFDVIFPIPKNVMKSISSSKSGFSLIEATMVVAIIGLLAAVAVPNLMGSKDAAEKASLVVGLRSMHTDQVAYHTTRARYARLSELNEFAGSLYGEILGSTLRKKDWTFLMTPTPTNATLRTSYQISAYKVNQNRVRSLYTIAQDGLVQTVVP